jgi:hypothetical protein
VCSQFVSEGISSVLLFYAAQNGASDEEIAQIQLLAFLLLLLPVFLPVMQKVYDGVVVNIILNCVRKKFNPQAALASMTILCLAIPAFAAKAFGVGGGGFNAAKLSGTVKSLTADAKKQKDAKKGATITVKRVVRRKKGYVDDYAFGAGANAAAQIEQEEEEEEEDVGDDGGGGDD